MNEGLSHGAVFCALSLSGSLDTRITPGCACWSTYVHSSRLATCLCCCESKRTASGLLNDLTTSASHSDVHAHTRSAFFLSDSSNSFLTYSLRLSNSTARSANNQCPPTTSVDSDRCTYACSFITQGRREEPHHVLARLPCTVLYCTVLYCTP